VSLWCDARCEEIEFTHQSLSEVWVFLYESLLELPVSIRRGDVAAEVSAFAREQQRDSDCDQRERQPALCGDLQPD